ncbi:DNA-binding bromodomain-containing protein [Raphanus sativus]|nr:DNA-binding bromodomain-containing protein [Raphanus sativus]
MKRKGGHKKGNKSKKSTEQDKLNESVQDSDSDQSCEHESKMVEVTSSSPSVVDPVKSVGRVKVKLKTSKAAPEPDVPLPTTKTSPQVERKEEPVPLRLPERKPVLNEPDEKTSQVKKPEPESAPVSSQNQQKKTDQISRYNKQELEDSLTVVKKIMKMEAADPFNVPVDPEALGIPDYFDIIKTPMDFGTVCSNLEKGNIYMNSEDVYKDVQYIWNNCSKYNKKGDYIVDLMKRVKKNFMKYWAAAGLYTEQSPESTQLEDGGNASSKGSQSKQKSQKRHGRHHKSDCMCAVCILKRRKRERHSSQGAVEESSPVRSPSMDNSSINMHEEQDMDVDVDNKTGQAGKTEIVELDDSPVAKRQRVGENVEEVETIEVESETKTKPAVEDKTQSIDRSAEETGDEPLTSAAEKLVVLASFEGPKSTQNDEEDKAKRLREQKELQELERKQWRAKMHEKFQLRNPQLLNLCETIFPNSKNHSSVWNGPHSLFKRPEGSNRTSSLHKAVEALMRSSN